MKIIGENPTNIIIAIAIIIIITVITLSGVKARTASPTPNASDQKFEDFKKRIASRAAEYKTEISKKIQNKAYAGQLTEIKDDKNPQIKTLTLMTKTQKRQVLVNEYTNYQDGINKKGILALKNLSKDDYLVALGDVDDSGTLTAKKVIKTKKTDLVAKMAIWGQIQSVFPSSITLTQANSQKFNLKVDGDTQYRLGSDEASFSDVKIGNFLISLGNKPFSDGKTPTTSTLSQFIYLLNPNGNLKISKNASASATPSASPKK